MLVQPFPTAATNASSPLRGEVRQWQHNSFGAFALAMSAMSELIAKKFLNMIIKLGLNARVMNCGRKAVPEMGVSVVDDS